jgi:(E)-4-hydroxy-3-methylbut-2-enyl-diphosphate synthase
MIAGRKKTKVISIGDVKIGGLEPVRVQSMTNTDTRDAVSTLDQIKELYEEGCEIVRVSVKDEKSAASLREITDKSPIPVVADIHFNYRLAIMSVEAGARGLRINPGNIGGEQKVREVVKCARDYQVPIRVGVNAGSLEKGIEEKYGGPTPEALVESALSHVRLIERYGYDAIKISLKASDPVTVIEGYSLLSQTVDYPLHLGVTEAGTVLAGSVKSSVALGVLLSQGIGDTIRVSLTGPPVEEVRVAYMILASLGLRQRKGIEIISCPVCGRCEWDLEDKAAEIEAATRNIRVPLKVAVMGCAVNGPGEAKLADIGVAGGRGECLLFKKGRVVGKVAEDQVVEVLLREIREMTNRR